LFPILRARQRRFTPKLAPEFFGFWQRITRQQAECRQRQRQPVCPFTNRERYAAMNSLTGKVAIVTGASSGIGRATAMLLAAEGASTVIAARGRAGLDRVVEEIEEAGGQAVAVAGDVRDEALAKALVDTAQERFGGLDIAVNNAGTLGEMAPVAALSTAGWRETIDANLTSAYLGAKYQVPAMVQRGGGSLIFTSTFVGTTVGFPGMSAYAASKAGVIGLAKVIAVEYGTDGVRANAVLPGGTDTPMGRVVVNSPEMRAFVENMHALKRLAEPEEIARSILHLASDGASFITGTAFLVDGGVSICRT
jgi:NAD(P)-dependent dehydrogenase (short-subunit alcohol dehydrogenase family)